MIQSRDIDFVSVMGEITEFAERNFYNRRQVFALQQVFEEAVIGNLFRLGDSVFPIGLNITSLNSGEDCVFEFSWHGTDQDLIEAGDETASAILRLHIRESVHDCSDGINHQRLSLKNR